MEIIVTKDSDGKLEVQPESKALNLLLPRSIAGTDWTNLSRKPLDVLAMAVTILASATQGTWMSRSWPIAKFVMDW